VSAAMSPRRLILLAACTIAAACLPATAAFAVTVYRDSDSIVANDTTRQHTNSVEVRVDADGNFVVGDSSGTTESIGCSSVDSTHVRCPADGVVKIRAFLGYGEDHFLSVGPTAVEADGGYDNDTIEGGSGGDNLVGGADMDVLVGGEGNDTLSGGGDTDSLSGGNGDDDLAGGSGADKLDGGPGDDMLKGGPDADTVDGGDGADSISVRDSTADSVTCGAGADRVESDSIDTIDASCETINGKPAGGSGGQTDTTSPAISMPGGNLTAKGGVVPVKVRCPATEVSCAGKVTLRSAGKVNGKVKLLGSKAFKAAGGKTATVKIKLSAANRKLLGKLGKLRVRATAVAHDPAGNVKTKHKTYVVKAPG
jgi:RTX calcium-binding nonapeptide repeat (4 copies)